MHKVKLAMIRAFRITAEDKGFIEREAMRATVELRRTFPDAREVTHADVIRQAISEYRIKREGNGERRSEARG